MRRCCKLVTILLLAGLTCACASRVTYLPVYSCPKPTLQEEPKYAIDSLTPKSTAVETVKASAISLEQCRGYANGMRNLLEVYLKFNGGK